MPSKPRQVPHNIFSGLRSRYQKHAVAPLPGQIIHPFYTPTKTAELAACSQEVRGRLVEGRKVFPVLSRDAKDQPILENRAVVWDTVKGANQWIQDFARQTTQAEDAVHLVLEGRPDSLIVPSKLHKSGAPLMDKLVDLFGAERSKHFNSAALDSLVDELVSDETSSVFCEDIYLYLLQHHVNSAGKLIAIIDSIMAHMAVDIDQMQVAETLVLQILFSFQRNKIGCTPGLVASFDRLIGAINDRFHTRNCEFQFQPLITQCVLAFYIVGGKLSDSKKLFAHLILKGWAPREEITVQYLQLVNRVIQDNDRDTMILKKFAYISDFRPLIKKGQSPALFATLIPYCRHFGELSSLLSIIISNAHNTKEVLDVTLLSIIDAAAQMGKNKRFQSANLYEVYHSVLPYYKSNLPNKFVKAFALKFAALKNWSAVASLFRRHPSCFPPNFIASLLTAPEEGLADATNYPGGVVRLRKIFIWEYLLPLYPKMSTPARLSVCGVFDTPKLFTEAVRHELDLVRSDQQDVMCELIQCGHKNKLLQYIPAGTWNDILCVPGLNAALEPLYSELNQLRHDEGSD